MTTDREPRPKPDREARLKAALRDNLRKRKQRDRTETPADMPDDASPRDDPRRYG